MTTSDPEDDMPFRMRKVLQAIKALQVRRVRSIAAIAECSVGTAHRAIRWLAAHGHIVIATKPREPLLIYLKEEKERMEGSNVA